MDKHLENRRIQFLENENERLVEETKAYKNVQHGLVRKIEALTAQLARCYKSRKSTLK